MSVPLVLKINFKPHQFIISPFGGMYYVFPISGSDPYNPPLGYTFGIEGGIHLGPGVLYIGLQFDSDLGQTDFFAKPVDLPFRRKIFSVSVGYSFGMIQRTIRETL
jgi:hypothetical protein